VSVQQDITAKRLQQAVGILEARGGVVRMNQALRAGIDRHTFYKLRQTGVLVQLSRGLYRLAERPALKNPDLVTVALKVPQGVICLLSALAFWKLTDKVPSQVHVAISRQSRNPRLDRPPVRVFRFSGLAFSSGVEMRRVDGVQVRIFGPEKTLADCFKFRKLIDIKTTLEGIKRFKHRKELLDPRSPLNRDLDTQALIHYAQILPEHTRASCTVVSSRRSMLLRRPVA